MTTFNNWNEEDLNELDAKFDALCEHLGIEFVFERVSDGSDTADRERCYVRSKVNTEIVEADSAPLVMPKVIIEEAKLEKEEYQAFKKKKHWGET